MIDVIDDTIVAVSSPPGVAARGIVRCSGPDTIRVAGRLFTPQSGVDLSTVPGFRRLTGVVELEAGCVIPGELYLFRAPRSYTRQDCAEFHVPGSPPVLTMLVERVIELGARAAQPGEFTARAFLSGAMDLTRAEAVAALIRSRSDSQLRAAQGMMNGRLSGRIDAALEQLAELVALVEADIDFAEEPIEFIKPEELGARLGRLITELHQLLETAESTERLDVLPHILLMGRSNAGKSTLMNRLTGLDRSICSPIRGTTRDILSAPVSLGRGEAVLLDTAGVDPLMKDLMNEAAEATVAAVSHVDLLCLVVDLSCTPDDAVFAVGGVRRPGEASTHRDGGSMPRPICSCIVVGNKTDLLDSDTLQRRRQWLEQGGRGPVCTVSAKTGQGIEACRQLLAQTLNLTDTALAADAVLITARQREAIEASLEAIRRCAAEASQIGETIDRADILAFELREALESLGSVGGSVTTEDLLGRVFASFCIGK